MELSWTINNDQSQQDTKGPTFLDHNENDNQMRVEEDNQKEIIQLNKYQDPIQNVERQNYISLVQHFGDFLSANNTQKMIETILTDNCEFFLFSSTGGPPVLYSLSPNDLRNIYESVKIIERKVRETLVDLEKSTVIQTCNMKILYEDKDEAVDEVLMEVFTIRDYKIHKYRAFSSCIRPKHGERDPFEPQQRDILLSKVKQINYAFADQPDLEKVASYLDETTYYKMWSWEDQKCFTFEKKNFAHGFRKVGTDLVLKRIVPYEIYTDIDVAVGTYVYHLEGKSGKYENKNYIWLNTCFFLFDADYNLRRVNQQGELYLEGSIELSFQAHSRDSLVRKTLEIIKGQEPRMDLIFDNIVDFKCYLYRFAPESHPLVGFYQGVQNMDGMKQELKRGNPGKKAWLKYPEVFVDVNDPSYDTVILLHCEEGIFNFDDWETNIPINLMHISKLSFENGKLAKIMVFTSEITEPIPSPFDDPDVEGINIKYLKK